MSSRGKDDQPEWMSVLLCGGIAGVATWASIFPLGESTDSLFVPFLIVSDVIKTRVQTQGLSSSAGTPANEAVALLRRPEQRLSTWQVTQKAHREHGWRVFFKGLGVCSARAFFVNAVQWWVYEWSMKFFMIPEVQSHTTRVLEPI